MTRLQKELDQFLHSLDFPTRWSKTYQNSGPSYPPYNLIRKSDSVVLLELAIAGFAETEISVSVENGYLKIAGKKVTDDEINFLYKGIGTRAFERSFYLSDDAKVTDASYVSGILTITVEYPKPEEKKPIQIPITTTEQKFLTE